MKLRKIFLIGIIFVIATSISGCKGKDFFKNLFSKDDEMEIIRSDQEEYEIVEDDSLRSTILYYKNNQGFLVPIMRKIPWEEGIAKLALKNMIDSPSLRENLGPTGLIPIIPTGTEILGMAIDNETGVCKVDFTKEFLNYETEKDEDSLIKGVVYTLTEFPAIKEVKILIEGESIETLKYGTSVGAPIRREDINLVKNLEDYRSKVIVYYKGNDNGEYEYFVPITIPTIAPMSNVFTALEELFNGPPRELNLYSNIPQGTNLQGVEIRDGIAYVDLAFQSSELVNEKYIFDEICKSVGLTLSEFEKIEKVELLIEGKTLKEAGIDLDYDESIPAFANEY